MMLLRLPGDPLYIMKDHGAAHGRAGLLAHLAAGVIDLLRPAEVSAGLAVDDRADLLMPAGPGGQERCANPHHTKITRKFG